MMKKLVSILFLLFLSLQSYSQVYQRMLIPKGQNIVIESGETMPVDAICLDYFKKVPIADAELNFLLSDTKNTTVIYNNKVTSLKSLLGNKSISIKGSNANQPVNQPDKFELIFINNTTETLSINFENDIQVGDNEFLKEAAFYGDYDQNNQWEAEFNGKLNEMGYANIYQYSLMNDFKNDVEFLNKLNKDYNKYLLKKAKNKKIITVFKNNNIGISGDTAKELLDNYNKAANKNISRNDIVNQVKKDFEERKLYILNNETGKYIIFLRGKKIINAKYKYSRFTEKNFEQIEKNLFTKKIDKSNYEILNFLDKSEDSKTFEMLNNLFTNNLSHFTLNSLNSLRTKLENNNIEYLFCVGHYKTGKIFTYIDGTPHYYSTDMLKDIAQELGINIFFIGCKSSLTTNGSSGTTINVNSIKMLNTLFDSLSNATNFGEFLSNMGSNITFEFNEDVELVIVRMFSEEDESNYYTTEESQVVIEFDLLNILNKSNTIIDILKPENDENKSPKD